MLAVCTLCIQHINIYIYIYIICNISNTSNMSNILSHYCVLLCEFSFISIDFTLFRQSLIPQKGPHGIHIMLWSFSFSWCLSRCRWLCERWPLFEPLLCHRQITLHSSHCCTSFLLGQSVPNILSSTTQFK